MSLGYADMNLGRFCRFLLLIAIILSSSYACQTPPSVDDPLETMIETFKSQNWTEASAYFDDDSKLEAFPLYQAMINGSTWIDLVRVRSLDHHLLFEVDLRASTTEQSRLRYTFWGQDPRKSDMSKSLINTEGLLTGWSQPYSVEISSIDLSNLDLPTRFSSTSYRIIGSHRKDARMAAQSLGVIGAQGSGAVESGWIGQFEFNAIHLNNRSKRRRKTCKRAKLNWNKYLMVLNNNLHQKCMRPLLFAAQRVRYLNTDFLSDRIDVSKGRGGQAIRQKQDQQRLNHFLDTFNNHPNQASEDTKDQDDQLNQITLSENGVSFNGRVTVEQSLEFKPKQRPAPRLIETIIIAPPLTQCIQKVTESWSRDFLVQDACQYTINIQFSVVKSSP
jgi:hypothetical protein